MKFGFELEAFVLNAEGQLALVPDGIPQDDCGWLVEYRSRPFDDPHEAVGSLLADRYRANMKLRALGLEPNLIPFAKVPRALKLEARRVHTKGLLCYQNLYGLKPATADTAGLHVSITKEARVKVHDESHPYEVTHNLLWDFPRLFRELDRRYAEEIRKARRGPGFYEIKVDQRIEYRSLPNTTDLWKLADFLRDWRW